MGTISFAPRDEDTVAVSGRTLDLLIDRAVPGITDPAEVEELRMCGDIDGISFDLFEPGTRARVATAFREGTLQLKRELRAGVEPLPNFGPGNIGKLDEILALLDRFIPADGTSGQR